MSRLVRAPLTALLTLGCALLAGCGSGDDEEARAEAHADAHRQTAVDLSDIAAAIEALAAADPDGKYPAVSGIEALAELLEPTYIEEMARRDPWGNALDYSSDGRSYILISPGPDGRVATDDDLQIDTGVSRF